MCALFFLIQFPFPFKAGWCERGTSFGLLILPLASRLQFWNFSIFSMKPFGLKIGKGDE